MRRPLHIAKREPSAQGRVGERDRILLRTRWAPRTCWHVQSSFVTEIAPETVNSAPPVRQEKQPASAEVIEVAPDVLRLQLPIALPGLAHINTYAIVGKAGVAIVDPGLPGPQSWKALERRMKLAGIATKHVTHVLITHSHPDHYGNAGRLAKAADAQLVTHRAFRMPWNKGQSHTCAFDDCVDPDHAHADVGQDPLPEAEMRFGVTPPWGGEAYAPAMKKGMTYRMVKMASGSPVLGRFFPLPKPTTRLRHDQAIRLGDRDWFAVHTPGHTLDHLCLFDPEGGTFMSGDHVLPTITPHISGIGSGANPLDSFFTSLDNVARLPGVKRVLPAHGYPFDDLAGRCADIRDHHRERLERLRRAHAEDRSSTVADYSHHLFRKERWGSMASSETYAHLEYLRLRGEAEKTVDANGEARYRFL